MNKRGSIVPVERGEQLNSNPKLLDQPDILQYLPVPVIICNDEGLVEYYNMAAEIYLGPSLTAGIVYEKGWNGCKLFYPDEKPLPAFELSALQLIQSGLPSKELVFILEKTNHSRMLVRQHMDVLYSADNKPKGVVSCVYTILTGDSENDQQETSGNNIQHQLKYKNEELKRSQDRFEKMIEEVEDYAIVLLDKNGIIRNWNKGAEKIKGYKDYEIVGKSFSNFYLQSDREKGLPDRLIKEAAEKGKATHEGWRLRKDGTAFWGSIVITALHDNQNNVTGFLKVTRDLTERKLAEDQLREYNTQLEFQNKELQQFAFAASHDMKEPLRKINFYNNYVITNGSDQLDEKSKDYLNRSMAAVKRMADLIDNLLSYSQIDSAAESFRGTDLNEIVEEIILSHKDVLELKEVNFQIGKLPHMHAIPFQMRQLFENLINNSIKYKHPERKSLIKITCQHLAGGAIPIREADAGTYYYKISVSDNGLGFQPMYADKIFEIFQRLKTQSEYKGSGIGLAICKKIVQNHRGFITATGIENQGASFDVYLPAREG